MLLRNTTAVVIIRLGFMTFRVWHERDSGRKSGRLSKMREFKSEVRHPTLFHNAGYPPNKRFS